MKTENENGTLSAENTCNNARIAPWSLSRVCRSHRYEQILLSDYMAWIPLDRPAAAVAKGIVRHYRCRLFAQGRSTSLQVVRKLIGPLPIFGSPTSDFRYRLFYNCIRHVKNDSSKVAIFWMNSKWLRASAFKCARASRSWKVIMGTRS